jgi:hypothetical protein
MRAQPDSASSWPRLQWEEPMMGEAAFVVSDADDGLRERLNEEINAFDVAATGLVDGALLGIAVPDDHGALRGAVRVDVGRVWLLRFCGCEPTSAGAAWAPSCWPRRNGRSSAVAAARWP